MSKPRPLWPLLIAAMICLPVLYVLRIGPIHWLQTNDFLPDFVWPIVEIVYSPLEWSVDNGPDWWIATVSDYIEFWVD